MLTIKSPSAVRPTIKKTNRDLVQHLIESGAVDDVTKQLIERGIASGPPFIQVPTDYVAKGNHVFFRDEPWLTVHPTANCEKTPEEQAILLADNLNNDEQDLVWPAPATGGAV